MSYELRLFPLIHCCNCITSKICGLSISTGAPALLVTSKQVYTENNPLDNKIYFLLQTHRRYLAIRFKVLFCY